MKRKTAYYHLPGLYEFYELYRLFLPLYKERRCYFYDDVQIASVYGAPAGALWGGGRLSLGTAKTGDVLDLVNGLGISARLTFSNSLLRTEHLADRQCSDLCAAFVKSGEKWGLQNGVIVHSELLRRHLIENYPSLYLVSSTTKVQEKAEELWQEMERVDFAYAVPDFRFNNHFDVLDKIAEENRGKAEFLCNECCSVDCQERKACYENVSRKTLGEEEKDHLCRAPFGGEGYSFSRAMESPSFIGNEKLRKDYLPRGFCHFKVEGRGLGSAVVLEMLLYYLVKPEYQIKVREAIYLDSMLDLF